MNISNLNVNNINSELENGFVYNSCVNFIIDHFTLTQYCSLNSASVKFLISIGFHEYFQPEDYHDKITKKLKCKSRLVIIRILKTMYDMNYVEQFSNSTWICNNNLNCKTLNRQLLYKKVCKKYKKHFDDYI